MFRNLNISLSVPANSGKNNAAQAMVPSLRTDLYTLMDQVKPWLVGDMGRGKAGDGVNYSWAMNVIQKYFPDAKMGLGDMGNTEGETLVVVRGVINMILELSKWDGMMGGMVLRTWVTALGDVCTRAAAANPENRADLLRKGISRAVEMADISLMTKEFAVRIQIISLLKSVDAQLYGVGSEEARQSDALWNSRFI